MLQLFFFFWHISCWFNCKEFNFWRSGNPFNQWVANSTDFNISSNDNTTVIVKESIKSGNSIPLNSLQKYLQTVLGLNQKNSETILKRIKFSQEIKTAIFTFNSSNIAIDFDALNYLEKTPDKFYNFFLERHNFYLHIVKQSNTNNDRSFQVFNMRNSNEVSLQSDKSSQQLLKSDLNKHYFDYKNYISIDDIEKENMENELQNNQNSKKNLRKNLMMMSNSPSLNNVVPNKNEKVDITMKEVKGSLYVRNAFLESKSISIDNNVFKQKKFFLRNLNSSCPRFGYECRIIPVYENHDIRSKNVCSWRNEVDIIVNKAYTAFKWHFNNSIENNVMDSYFNLIGQDIESYILNP